MGTNLKFVRVRDINQIPRYLFEQVKPQEFNINALYEWAPVLFDNPLNLFGAFVDSDEIVQGVMWGSYNPISNALTVHVLSIDKKYFGRGILKEADGIVRKWQKKLNADRIMISTTRPRAFESIGYRRSNLTLMEKNYE